MKKSINFGIGFITGRPNICRIINSYYKYIVEQVNTLEFDVKFTCFILYDLDYLKTNAKDFYNILPEVHEYVKIKYLTPEDVMKKNKEIVKDYGITQEEADLLIGKGYAKARNTILYEALKDRINYLLFWDDDEYPLAALKEGKDIKWIKQENVLEHIKNIENTDVTFGYRCGMINPLPYVKYNDIITEEVYKDFIEAISNEVISWDKVNCMHKTDFGIGFAEEQIANHIQEIEELDNMGNNNYVLGSGICLNLDHIEKIPAFYNPPGARGEDTFFSCALADTNARVSRIPVYHFHDAFLKFQFLMENKFPKKLKKIVSEDSSINQRFERTTTGWIKYKPLLYYIIDRNNYRKIINESILKLENTAEKINTAFSENCDLTNLTKVLKEYDKNVENHYEEYLKTNEVWNKIKIKIKQGVNL